MALPRDWVAESLRAPRVLSGCSPGDWDLLVRQASAADLTARIAHALERLDLLGQVPAGPRQHLEGALTYARSQHEQVRREVGYVCDALVATGVRPVLLKGAAYVMRDLDAACGRMFSDVDILVPRDRIADVEGALMVRGWATTHHSPYDQRYYREWMHEIPPLQHIRRGTVLDVHHSILPLTGRVRPNAGLLIENARIIDSMPSAATLAPADMVIHSMTHLFHNEEFTHGLRDLSDIDLLLRDFGRTPDFWADLIERGAALGLMNPLYLGLSFVGEVLRSPVPPEVLAEARQRASGIPMGNLAAAVWHRALRSPHPTAADGWTASALFLLYLRSHWLKMPPVLLFRHLAVKGWRRMAGEEKED